MPYCRNCHPTSYHDETCLDLFLQFLRSKQNCEPSKMRPIANLRQHHFDARVKSPVDQRNHESLASAKSFRIILCQTCHLIKIGSLCIALYCQPFPLIKCYCISRFYYQLPLSSPSMQQNKPNAQPITQTTIPSMTDWHAADIAAADPCNSAIKKIAGKEIYLKDNPNALILLQSAEIERLTNYLNDYKCKYRSLSRQQLDRQSYEVQIKQLFERDARCKLEAQRLNKIITTLTITGEQYKKQLLAALEKNKALAGENTTIRERNFFLEKELKFNHENFDKYIAKSQAEIHSLTGQLASHRTYTESVLKNNADLLARVNTIPNIQRRIFELETQLKFSNEQNERLNKELETRAEKLVAQEKSQAAMNERYNMLSSVNENLKKEIASHTQVIESTKLLTSKLLVQNQQVKDTHDLKIKETSKVLAKKGEELDALSQQLKDYNSRMTQVQRLNEDLRKSVADLQTKNAALKQDILKLNDSIKLNLTRIAKYECDEAALKKVIELKDAEWQTNLQSQKAKEVNFANQLSDLYEKHTKEINNLKDQIAKIAQEKAEVSSKLEESQKNLHVTRGQLKLSQQIIKTQQAENARLTAQEQLLKTTKIEKESLTKTIGTKKAEIAQIEKALKQGKEREKELTNKIADLTKKYQELNDRFTAENISLNKMIHNKVTQSQKLKKLLIENENALREEFQNSLNEHKKTIDQNLVKIAKINEEKTALADEHSQLKVKHEETAKLKSELQEKQEQLSSKQKQEQAKMLLLQIALKKHVDTVQALRDQEAALKKKMAQKDLQIDQLQKDIKALKEQKQQSQNELTTQKDLINQLKVEAIKFNIERSCYNMQIHDKSQEIKRLQQESKKLTEEIAKIKEANATLLLEREQLSNMFQSKTKENQGLKRKMIELQTEMRDSFEQALKETEDKHSKAYELILKEKEELNKKIEEIEPHVKLASSLQKHKEVLEENLKTASANQESQKTKAAALAQEIETLRKTFADTETQLKAQYESKASSQSAKHAKEIEQLIKEKQHLSSQRDSLFTITNEYQTRTSLLVQQIDRLHTIINNNIAQNKTDMDLQRSTNTTLKGQIQRLSLQLSSSQKRQEQLKTSYKTITKRLVYYQELLSNLQSEFISIQLMTTQLRQQRDLLLKKNAHIVKSIRTLSNQLDNLETQGDNMTKYFTKESTIHKDLGVHYEKIQKMFNQLDSFKGVVEETVEVVEIVKS